MSAWLKHIPGKVPKRRRTQVQLGVDFSLSPESLAWIETEAEKLNITRSVLVRTIVYEAYLTAKGEK